MTFTPRHGKIIFVRQCIFLAHAGHIRTYLHGTQPGAPLGKVENIEILGLECAHYCSKLFGLTHACGTNMAANDGQKDCYCD